MTEREKQIEEIADIISEFDDCEYQSMATDLYEAGYRKMDEVTLKLDLGDRTPEEIKQIAEMFNGEIKKQVAKEILDEIRKNEVDAENCDCWLVSVRMEQFASIFKKYGVEIDKNEWLL